MSASVCRTDTTRAFSTASTSAQAPALSPVARASRLIRASSTAEGSISNVRPAARSSAARVELDDASIKRSGIDALAPHQQLVDRRSGLLDRASGDVDDRPMMLGKNTPGLTHLSPHRLNISIIGSFVVIEHAEPVTAQQDKALRIIGQADDEGLRCP